MLMVDFAAKVIADYERFQEMPLELSAEIDMLLEERPGNKDIGSTRRFLAERFNALQDEIDRWRDAQSMAECLRRLPLLPGAPAKQKEESDGEEAEEQARR